MAKKPFFSETYFFKHEIPARFAFAKRMAGGRNSKTLARVVLKANPKFEIQNQFGTLEFRASNLFRV